MVFQFRHNSSNGLTSKLRNRLLQTACVACLAFAAPSNAEVVINSLDGSLSISGELISFDNKTYVVKTSQLGTLNIPASQVTCEGAECPDLAPVEPQFGIYGSRTVSTTLIPNLLRGYAKSVGATFELETTDLEVERFIRLTNPDGTLRAEIDLQNRGSATGFPALVDGRATIALTDRRMNEGDVEVLATGGLPDLRGTENETVLGLDGIVMITNPANPVRNLSALDIARIYAGEITNWRQLGGGNLPITVNSYATDSGDRAVMLNGLVRPNNRDETADVSRWAAYQELVDAVMEQPGGIGFVGRWLARTNDVNLVTIREECGLLSPPSDFRMKIEGYTLSRRLWAYTKPGDVHPEAQAFLDWTLTPEAQPYIKEVHFIDRELERMRLEDMGMMLIHNAASEPDFDGEQYAQMMRDLRNADRLSISFRFNTASATLDTESERNVAELGRRLQAGQFDGMEVLLVGFADSVGEPVRNTNLALSRAQAVQDILRANLPPELFAEKRFIPLSYGELLPLSCNETEIGRERNRRVEVWLRPVTQIASQ